MKKIALALSFLLILAAVIGTSAQDTMPVMEGTNIKTAAKKAKEFGLSEPFGDEDFGHGTKLKSLSNDSYTLMIDIVYSARSKEILCANVMTSPLTSASLQRNFILGMAGVLCPPADADEVTSWINKQIGKEISEEINGIDYALSFGPKNNLLFDAGVSRWEEWDLSFN